MPSPELSAKVAKQAISQLTKYVKDYRAKKIKVDLVYLNEQHKEAKQKFFTIRDSLAAYRDAHQNLSTAKAKTKAQALQSKYDLTNNLYNGLSQQLQQSRLKLQEQTPVFKTLDPVQVPIQKSSPNRLLIVIVCMLLAAYQL